MKLCAMLDFSAGNESVGEMWTETAEFDDTSTLAEVLLWVGQRKGYDLKVCKHYSFNLRLAVLQDPKE